SVRSQGIRNTTGVLLKLFNFLFPTVSKSAIRNRKSTILFLNLFQNQVQVSHRRLENGCQPLNRRLQKECEPGQQDLARRHGGKGLNLRGRDDLALHEGGLEGDVGVRL